MSALIDLSNNRENLAYVGQKPWHGLGVELESGTDLDKWRVAAGMDFTVERKPVMFTDDDKLIHTVPNQDVLFRSDTKASFGVVSDRYKIVQPQEVIEFYRDLTDQYGFEIETAGCLDGGKRIWALAKTGQEMRIKGQDNVEGYLLLATSYDKSLATRASFTSVRVVCNNTLSMAYSNMSDFVRVTHAATFDANSVKRDLNIYESNFKQFTQDVELLSDTKISRSAATKFLMELLADEADIDRITTRKANQVAEVFKLYDGLGRGSQFRSAKDTAWGLVNAVTEYVDHHSQNRNQNNRFKDSQFGRGDKMKNKAMIKAMQIAKAA